MILNRSIFTLILLILTLLPAAAQRYSDSGITGHVVEAGTGEHIPGITISILAKKWKRTKSAISQNVKKLEAKGLVYRVRDGEDAKIFHLYPTDEGVRLSTAHKLYDNVNILQAQNDLLRSCTPEEIDAFYKVLDTYCKRF